MPSCPVCPARALDVDVSLDGCGCARCGGVWLPSTGSELLFDELGVAREQLREIAAGYAGRGVSCPSCRTRMRPLALRGVDVQLCFGCGALWLVAGSLETLTKGRHRGPRGTTTLEPARARATLQRPTRPARIDLRPWIARVAGSTLRIASAVGAALWGFGMPHPGLAALVGLFVVGTALRRGDWLDVHPRAGRWLRNRRVVPPDAEDPAMQKLDDDARLVVRPLLPGLVRPVLVDGAGRTLCALAPITRVLVQRRMRALARRVGVHTDDDDAARPTPAAPLHPALVGPALHEAWSLEPDEDTARRQDPDVLRLSLRDVQRRRIAQLRNDVRDLTGVRPAGRHALCFALRDVDDAPILRLHDAPIGAQAWTVVVDAHNVARAAVARPRRLWERWRCAVAGSDVEVVLAARGLDASRAVGRRTVRAGSRVVAWIEFPTARWAGNVRFARAHDASDDEVFAAICLWLHVAIERTPT